MFLYPFFDFVVMGACQSGFYRPVLRGSNYDNSVLQTIQKSHLSQVQKSLHVLNSRPQNTTVACSMQEQINIDRAM
jgi:hypothetical protein